MYRRNGSQKPTGQLPPSRNFKRMIERLGLSLQKGGGEGSNPSLESESSFNSTPQYSARTPDSPAHGLPDVQHGAIDKLYANSDWIHSVCFSLFGKTGASILQVLLPFHCWYGPGRCFPSDQWVASNVMTLNGPICKKTVMRFRHKLKGQGLIEPTRRMRPTVKESQERGEEPWRDKNGKLIAGLSSTCEWGLGRLVALLFKLVAMVISYWHKHSYLIDPMFRVSLGEDGLWVKLGALWSVVALDSS